MSKVIAIIEGNHQGLVGTKNGTLYGAAEGFADCLRTLDDSLTFDIIRPHFEGHQTHSALFDVCDGIVFTGSANYWSADDEPAAPARQVMSLALGSKIPIFGSCYGLQLAVAVLGGANQANPIETEFAIARDITINETGRSHPLYHGKADIFDARCMHRDEVSRLPDGAICLSANAHSDNQAIVYEKDGICFWGVQYHPELRFPDIANYIEKNDVASFADAEAFAARLSIEADLPEIISDFKALEQAQEALHQKYQLTSSLIDNDSHTTELRNFLACL